MAERKVVVYIQDLDISDKGKRDLLRLKILTLNELERKGNEYISASGISDVSLDELQKVLSHIDEIFDAFENRKKRIDEISDELIDIDIDKIPFSNKAMNSLKRANVTKVCDMIRMSQKDIISLRSVGIKTMEEITSAINAIISEGSDYFTHPHLDSAQENGQAGSDNGQEPDFTHPHLEGVQENAQADTENDQKAENRVASVSEEVCSLPIDKLKLSSRALNGLKSSNITTVGDLIRLTKRDITDIRRIGSLTQNEILTVIDDILSHGNTYFISSKPAVKEVEQTEKLQGKGFDYDVIDTLTDRFSFKTSGMTDWFDLSKQRISDLLNKRSWRRSDTWTGKELSEREHAILKQLVEDGHFSYEDDQVTCICMNNLKDDLACLFIYKDEIKCFFLKDLPALLQTDIVKRNYHRYTIDEMAGESSGGIVYAIRKPYFLPAFPYKFRKNAQLRNMSPNEYAIFISGYPILATNSVTDDRIKSFFDENLVDGKVYMSSDSKNQWIRSLAYRNGYSIKEFIESYGYESKLDGTELTTDGARERHIEELRKFVVRDNVVYFPTDSNIYRMLNTYVYHKGTTINKYLKTLGYERTTERPETADDVLEKDMEVRQSDGKFEDKVFARYPLLGSRILKQETLDKLNKNSRKYIDTVLREPSARLPLQAEMQITLALVNNAKNWNYEENSEFWKYITMQFGYLDSSHSVERLLQSSLEHALKKNQRLFIEDSNGRAFKSTVLIHALASKKTWMALFDFLFDFYKNNLNWKVITGDPLIGIMVRSLQQKLVGDGSDDMELTISSRVYSFQEGIRKLVLYRPVFAKGLFEKLLLKIDEMINSVYKQASTYEEKLCETWFKEKITAIANTKKSERQAHGTLREVEIDYSHIRAKYILKNGKDIYLVLPDIRLKNESIESAVITLYSNGSIVRQQPMTWYGNELGKTLMGVSMPLPSIPEGAEAANVQVKITCDNQTIYDSEDALNRRAWFFYGENETNAGQIKKDNYTIVLPRAVKLHTENIEETEIDGLYHNGLKAYFLELKDGYIVTADDQLITFDSENGADIRVTVPSELSGLLRAEADGQEYYFACRDSACSIILGNRDCLQRFVILRDGERVAFSSLPSSGSELAFQFPLSGNKDTCRLQVINLNDNRLVFDKSFMLIKHVSCRYNREFYYFASDYQNAECRIDIDDFSEIVTFGPDADEVRIPYRNGELHVAIPKIEVGENSGSWMYGSAPAWYIGEIPQTSILKVSAPPKVNIRFLVGGRDIMYDGQGLVYIGNYLQSLCGTENVSLEDVQMKVTGINQNGSYLLARVSYKEQFLVRPEFWTKENRLYWNQGGTFIGKPGRTFTLTLLGEADTPVEFMLDENTESVEIPEDMPKGNYRYEISIQSGNLFKKIREVIAVGSCVVGDSNVLRFKGRRIVVDSITDDLNEENGHITIRTCYIDQIEYKGIEATSEGKCPVYSGIMYTDGYRGERYEFSFDKHTKKNGVTKIMVNPVKIIYRGDWALSITDPDGDGLYYYHYYDTYLRNTVYEITDHEYTEKNRNTYSTADLYSYSTERINNV